MQAAQTHQADAVQTASKAVHVGLWVLQAGLGAMFIAAGVMKVGISQAEILAMGEQQAWVLRAPEALIRFIGVAELAGGLGLILPAATRIKPWLTPLAAAGLTTVMVLAAGVHVLHGEFAAITVNVVLGTLTALVAYGRFRPAPIASR
ncbi:MAG: DoxX family protein [Myxococcota bacterium]